MMLAVLPRRQADDIAGELFVAAYEQALWQVPEGAMDYLTHRAIAEKKWFPTVKECLDILKDWTRPHTEMSDYYERRRLAGDLAFQEREARREESRAKFIAHLRRIATGEASPDELAPELQAVARNVGAVTWNDEAKRYEPSHREISTHLIP